MNEFGKICVVFATAASLGFVAFAGAMRTGGRNWMAEADDLRDEYLLSIVQGEQQTTYSMTQIRTNSSVGNSPVLADVVTAARSKQVQVAREEQERWEKEAQKYLPGIQPALAATAADEAGLKLRDAALTEQLEQVAADITRINMQITDAANEAQRIRNEGQERREEVYRLRNQLELLRTDLYAAQVQRKNLEEEEVRLQEILQRLERRKLQLSADTNQSGD